MNTEHFTAIIVRHGESVGNLAGDNMTSLDKSNYDFELTELGVQQARAAKHFIGTKFPASKGCSVLASTFLRSQETAQELSTHSKPIQIDPRLDERWDGVLHALPKPVLEERYPEQAALRKKYGWYHHRAPGGENGPDVEMRIRSLLQDLRLMYASGQHLIFSTHGNWMLLFERLAKGIGIGEINRMRKDVKIPNGCISAYRVSYPLIEPIIERHIPNLRLQSVKEHFA